jgi:AcrR family transcriptional regulator
VATARRIGTETSPTRAALLDAAAALMVEEGYAAVTSRKIAARAGLKPQLVHYYFRTMDDLFLALFRRGAEHNLARLSDGLASPTPLSALWELMTDPTGTRLMMEFLALANHRKSIRSEIAAYAERFRAIQVEAAARLLAGRPEAGPQADPAAVVTALVGVAQVLVLEEALGVQAGHRQTRDMVRRCIADLEGPPTRPPAGRARPARRRGRGDVGPEPGRT